MDVSACFLGHTGAMHSCQVSGKKTASRSVEVAPKTTEENIGKHSKSVYRELFWAQSLQVQVGSPTEIPKPQSDLVAQSDLHCTYNPRVVGTYDTGLTV